MIRVATSSTNQNVREKLEIGVARWNSLLSVAPTGYRRVFSWIGTDTSAAHAIVHVHGQSGQTYCGKVDPSTFVINLYVLGTTDCPTNNSYHGSIETVLAHELSSVIGWAEGVENLGVAGVSNDYCVSTFMGDKSPGPLSTNMCYHDVNGVMRLYNLGTVNLGEHYWSTVILSESDVGIANDTVAVGATTSITATYLATGQHSQASTSVSTGPSNFQALFSAPGIASRAGNSIQGESTGSVQIRFRPFSAPGGFDLWEPLYTEGNSTSLTVVPAPPPPPPPPFKVDRISPDTGAITVAGWLTFTANVVSAPGTPVSTRWIVIDSRTPTVADTIWRYGHVTLDINIPASASYNLSLSARPHYNQVIGIEYTQDVPVCTGESLQGGGGQLGLRKTGDPAPNAIPGCGSGGGGTEW